MEKRKEPRYKIDAAVEVKYGTTTINAKAIEISRHGIKIESTDLIEPGTIVAVVLFLKEPERISGEVKWVLAEPGQGKVNYRIGIYCEMRNFIANNASS